MAVLDDKRDALVVRVVYDGPPFSGKTTTLLALSQELSRSLDTPGEHDGRTLYFDWLDYTAGRFEGRPIRCQVVSVPGQRSLVERRRHIIRDADSVVFVADTSGLGMELSLKYATELAGFIGQGDEPRPGVIVQANKRDVDDALAMPEIVDQFRRVGIEAAFIETTATSGVGVREAFLFGVRLALDRVRELSARGTLRTGRPEVDSSGELLDQLIGNDEVADTSKWVRPSPSPARGTVGNPRMVAETPAEAGTAAGAAAVKSAVKDQGAHSSDSIAAGAIREALEREEGAALIDRSAGEQAFPDPSVPSGFIWPPVAGRIMIQQALADQQLVTSRLQSGDLFLQTDSGWAVHSRAMDYFESQHEARSALVEWARVHVRNGDAISERRCIALSPSGSGWRLWQIVGRTRSLQSFLLTPHGAQPPRYFAECLFVAARKLIAAASVFCSGTVALPVRLTTVAADTPQPVYVGLMPAYDREISSSSIKHSQVNSGSPLRHLEEVVDSLLQSVDLNALLDELRSIGQESSRHKAVIDGLLLMLKASRAA